MDKFWPENFKNDRPCDHYFLHWPAVICNPTFIDLDTKWSCFAVLYFLWLRGQSLKTCWRTVTKIISWEKGHDLSDNIFLFKLFVLFFTACSFSCPKCWSTEVFVLLFFDENHDVLEDDYIPGRSYVHDSDDVLDRGGNRLLDFSHVPLFAMMIIVMRRCSSSMLFLMAMFLMFFITMTICMIMSVIAGNLGLIIALEVGTRNNFKIRTLEFLCRLHYLWMTFFYTSFFRRARWTITS